MQLIERFVVALESIAASLDKAAGNPAPVTVDVQPPGDAPKPGRKRSSTTEATPPKQEKVEATPPKTETEPPAFDYEILKRAVIELASFGDDGRSEVLRIFAKHKVKDNKAANAPEALWPTLHTEVTDALTKLQTAEGGEGDDAFA